ncbi:MAG: RidA family protein [Candidatus Limnocylindria bacterium]
MRTAASDDAPAAIGPYSQALVFGDLVFCSGQVALEPRTGALVEGDARAQTARALDNLSAVLRAAGSDLSRVLKTTVYLTDLGDFEAMNDVYGSRFGAHRPARATVGVASLPKGARVEIECVAARE